MFRIEVNTLDGKLSYERSTASAALQVAEAGEDSLGVTIVDEGGESYTVEQFRERFGN